MSHAVLRKTCLKKPSNWIEALRLLLIDTQLVVRTLVLMLVDRAVTRKAVSQQASDSGFRRSASQTPCPL